MANPGMGEKFQKRERLELLAEDSLKFGKIIFHKFSRVITTYKAICRLTRTKKGN